MWLGVVAGLLLLILSTTFAPLAHAQTVSVTDQQLQFEGPGWRASSAPQACAGVSPSVHSTTANGDTVSYSFTGNSVVVHGQSTFVSNPLTVILDNAVQPAPLVAPDGTGCGVLYSNSNIPSNGKQHNLLMVFAPPSGSASVSISGITTTSLSPNDTANVGNSVPPNSSGTPTISSTPTQNAGANAGPTAGTPSSAAASGSNPTGSVIQTSSATPTMTVGVIGAIVGTVCGMVLLLVIFMLIRRRITRQTARRMDQQGPQEMEEGKRKGPGPLINNEPIPAWGTKANGAMPSAPGGISDLSVTPSVLDTSSRASTYTVNLGNFDMVTRPPNAAQAQYGPPSPPRPPASRQSGFTAGSYQLPYGTERSQSSGSVRTGKTAGTAPPLPGYF